VGARLSGEIARRRGGAGLPAGAGQGSASPGMRSREVGAPLHFVRDRFASGLPETNLVGEHQRRNAGAALLACELAARLPIEDAKARAALRSVEWAGRWQEFRLADGRPRSDH
jgi:folylpolyglutamate synthase/dihydropteroate synthase